MMPFFVNLMELTCYQPFTSGVQKHGLIPAYVSMEEVDKCVTSLFITKGDEYVMCTDFSSFDQTFREPLQDAAEAILRMLLTDCDQSNR